MSGGEDDGDAPVIGVNLDYSSIAKEQMEVESFLSLSTYSNGTVEAVLPNTPYGLLTVYVGSIEQQAVLPVVHKVDYVNARELWQSVEFNQGEALQLYVAFVPAAGLKRLLAAILPRLQLSLYSESGLLAESRLGTKKSQTEWGASLQAVTELKRNFHRTVLSGAIERGASEEELRRYREKT